VTAGARTLTLVLAGQEWTVEVSADSEARVHRPVLRLLAKRAASRPGRLVVFIAGPPAAGKTTLAALWEHLAREDPEMAPVQALPLDGFHFRNEYLIRTTTRTEHGEVPLRKLKGSPETFDVRAVEERLRAVRAGRPVTWPSYDRRIHDPVDGAIDVVARGVLLVEGNYLLLDEPAWRDLSALADYRIFIESAPDTLVDALRRHERGGMTPEAALAHHRLVDQTNYRRVMERRMPADLTLTVDAGRAIAVARGDSYRRA
jgi:putative kinase